MHGLNQQWFHTEWSHVTVIVYWSRRPNVDMQWTEKNPPENNTRNSYIRSRLRVILSANCRGSIWVCNAPKHQLKRTIPAIWSMDSFPIAHDFFPLIFLSSICTDWMNMDYLMGNFLLKHCLSTAGPRDHNIFVLFVEWCDECLGSQ